MDVERPDVSHWLIDAARKKGSLEEDREWLNGDAVTIIIAGRSVLSIHARALPFYSNLYSITLI